MTDNSYPPGNPFELLPLDATQYYGSQHILRLALQAIGSIYPNSIEIIGLPGMGKSFLLRYLAIPETLARHKDSFANPFNANPELLFPILINFRSLPEQENPAAYLFRRYRNISQTYVHLLAQKHPELEPELESLLSDAAHELPEQPILAILTAFQKLNHLGVRPILLFDNFDTVFAFLSDEEIEQMSLWKNLAAFIMCTEKRLGDVNPRGSTLFGVFDPTDLGGLSKTEAQSVLTKPAEKSGVAFPSPDIEFILKQAAGHMSLLLLGGKVLWDFRRQLGLLEADIPLSSEQIDLFQKKLAYEYQSRFKRYWETLSTEEKLVLEALARAAVPPPMSQTLNDLEARGLITLSEEHNFQLFSSLFARFIQMKEGTVYQPSSTIDLDLTDIESRLFHYLLNRQEQTCRYEAIWQAVWHDEPLPDAESTRRRIQVVVSRLKPKLSEQGFDLISVRKQGYRLTSTSPA